MKYTIRFSLFIFVFLCSNESHSQNSNFSFFGNIGLTQSSSKYLGFKQDISKEDAIYDGELDIWQNSRVGLQYEYQLSPILSFTSQALLQKEKDYSLDKIIKMAFIRYKANNNFSIRLGRTPFDMFMLSESRDIDFSYLWAYPPQEIYSLLPNRYIDGIDLIYKFPLEQLDFRTKLSIGKSEIEINANDDVGHLKIKQFIGLTTELSDFNWSISFRASRSKLDGVDAMLKPVTDAASHLQNIWLELPQFYSDLNVENISGDYISLGGRYEFEKLTLFAELAQIKGNSSILNKVDSGYVSASYNINDIDYFISYAYSESRTKTVNIKDSLVAPFEYLPPQLQTLVYLLNPAINDVLNFFTSNQTTSSIGMRWNYSENIVFKLQLNNTKIDANGSTLWTVNPAYDNALSSTHSVNTVFANMSFVF